MKRILSCAAICLVPSLLWGQEPAVTLQQVRSALPKLEQLVAQTLEDTGLPGMAIAVVYQDQVMLEKGFGVRKAGEQAPIDADTVFQLASLSKPIGSTVIAAAVGQGIVDWDDRVIDHLPELQLADPWITRQVRIRDFLSHRSGLPDHAGDLLEDIGYDRGQVLHRLRYLRRLGKFRMDYAYTNFGYTAAGEAAARAAGMSWEELSSVKLYRPLGMTATSSKYADYLAAENRATIHALIDGKYVPKYQRHPDAQAPAGGVSSSARDMARYLRLQLGAGKFEGQQIVAAAALTETHTPQVITGYDPQRDRTSLYGLGWIVGHHPNGQPQWVHSGAFASGVRTEIAILPKAQLGIVTLTNGAPNGIPEAISASLWELVFAGKTSRDWVAFANEAIKPTFAPTYDTDYSQPPPRPSPPLDTKVYAGTYHNDYYGNLKIVAAGGKLTMQLGPRPLDFALRHWDRDVFVYQPQGENAYGPSGVMFAAGPGGKINEVTVENLNILGEGTFRRAE